MIAGYLDLARAHAPLLMMAAPLAAAALAFVAPSARLAWVVAVLAAVAAAVLAGDLAWRALIGAAPVAREGAAIAADGVALFAAPILLCATALALFSAGAQLKEFTERHGALAISLALLCASAWTGALVAQDLVAMFVAVETAWLAGLSLVAMSPRRGALVGAQRMIAVGGVGAALLLLGIAFVTRGAGASELAELPYARIASPALTSVGVGMMILALAAKAALVPAYDWAAAAYGRAGRMPSLILGAVGAIGALAVLVRVAAHVIPAPDIGAGASLALALIGALSVVFASVQAMGATNVLRLAAYAGAAQAGVVLLTLGLGSPAAFAAALVQLFAMCAAALALIGGAAAGGVQDLKSLDGLGRRAPLAGAAITAAALSLMGAPLTAGFLGRWRLIEAGVGAGWWWAAGAVIMASLAGVFYGGRLVERLYFRRVADTFAGERDAWRFVQAPAALAAIVAIAVGFAPDLLLRLADAAAVLALGAGA